MKSDDYRFVVTEGQHRMACLAALGYDRIRCRFSGEAHYPQVVALEDSKNWPQVSNGVYSRSLGTKVFYRFFTPGVGRERMGI